MPSCRRATADLLRSNCHDIIIIMQMTNVMKIVIRVIK